MAETTEPTEYMLTTVDNPFNPFTRFDEWLEYDIRLGYNTSAFLDRVAKIQGEVSEPDQAIGIDNAMDQIIKENVSGMWRKVSRTSAEKFEV